MSRMKEDRDVCHKLLIDHFHIYLNHYKPFAKPSLLIRSDWSLDVSQNCGFFTMKFSRSAFGKILSLVFLSRIDKLLILASNAKSCCLSFMDPSHGVRLHDLLYVFDFNKLKQREWVMIFRGAGGKRRIEWGWGIIF